MDQSTANSGRLIRQTRRLGGDWLVGALLGLCLQLILTLQALAQEPGSYLIHTVGGGREGTLTLPSGQSLPALATYFQAFDLTLDPAGNLFFVDRFSRVFKVDRSGVISLVAGGFFGYGGDGGPALAAQLNQPAGIAFDKNGNLYFADRSNHRVRRVSPAGIITNFAGTGSSGSSGDGGPALSAHFDKPGTIAIDPSGNLYVSDITGSIRRVDASGIITTVAQQSGDALTMHPSGALYFVKDNQVRKLEGNGAVTVVAGAGQAGFDGDHGPAVDALLNHPAGLAFDQAGNLYIADSLNRLVRKVTSDGIIRTIAGTGVKGHSGDGGNPCDVVIDKQGNLYIADWGNQRIRKVSNGGMIDTFAGTGTRGFSGDGGPAVSATLADPEGVAVDSAGNVFLADSDNHRVRRVDPSGKILTIAGIGPPGFNGNGLPAVAAQLDSPQAIAVDSAGNLLVADSRNHQVRRIYRGDPSQTPPSLPSTWILPSSARSQGLNGSFFTTEITLANTGNQDASITLAFLGNNQDGRNGVVKTLTLAAGKSVFYSDVLGTLFGVADGYGAIRVTSSSAALAIQGQTSTPTATRGTYGQSVPAVRYPDWIAQGLPRTIVGIREDGQFRTNLVLANATADVLEADLQLRSREGIELASRWLVLRPRR